MQKTYLEWLAKENFAPETTIPMTGGTSFSRPCRLGHPKCRESGALMVNVIRLDGEDEFTMNVTGKARNYWTTISAYQIPEAELVKEGRNIEHRLVSAWMEMVS